MSSVVLPVLAGGRKTNTHRNQAREAFSRGAAHNGHQEFDPIEELGRIATDPAVPENVRVGILLQTLPYLQPKVKAVETSEAEERPELDEGAKKEQYEKLKGTINSMAGAKAKLYLVPDDGIEDAEVVEES